MTHRKFSLKNTYPQAYLRKGSDDGRSRKIHLGTTLIYSIKGLFPVSVSLLGYKPDHQARSYKPDG